MANISNIIISYTSIISHILNTRNISNRRVVESVSARWRKALVAHVKTNTVMATDGPVMARNGASVKLR